MCCTFFLQPFSLENFTTALREGVDIVKTSTCKNLIITVEKEKRQLRAYGAIQYEFDPGTGTSHSTFLRQHLLPSTLIRCILTSPSHSQLINYPRTTPEDVYFRFCWAILATPLLSWVVRNSGDTCGRRGAGVWIPKIFIVNESSSKQKCGRRLWHN